MNKAKATGIGGLVAAGIGSVCCVSPIVLTGLGIGAGAISFAKGLTFLHWPMLILAFILFGMAFYFYYREKSGSGIDGKSCEILPGKLPKG